MQMRAGGTDNAGPAPLNSSTSDGPSAASATPIEISPPTSANTTPNVPVQSMSQQSPAQSSPSTDSGSDTDDGDANSKSKTEIKGSGQNADNELQISIDEENLATFPKNKKGFELIPSLIASARALTALQSLRCRRSSQICIRSVPLPSVDRFC